MSNSVWSEPESIIQCFYWPTFWQRENPGVHAEGVPFSHTGRLLGLSQELTPESICLVPLTPYTEAGSEP